MPSCARPTSLLAVEPYLTGLGSFTIPMGPQFQSTIKEKASTAIEGIRRFASTEGHGSGPQWASSAVRFLMTIWSYRNCSLCWFDVLTREEGLIFGHVVCTYILHEYNNNFTSSFHSFNTLDNICFQNERKYCFKQNSDFA